MWLWPCLKKQENNDSPLDSSFVDPCCLLTGYIVTIITSLDFLIKKITTTTRGLGQKTSGTQQVLTFYTFSIIFLKMRSNDSRPQVLSYDASTSVLLDIKENIEDL